LRALFAKLFIKSMGKTINSTISYTIYNNFNELSEDDQKLVVQAQEACKTSYSPYSNFTVGAALLLEDETVIPGSNQENAAYPLGLCAERVALFASGSIHPGKTIKKLAVAARRANTEAFLEASPCGSCRQVMLEFEGRQSQPIELIMRWGTEAYVKLQSVSDLLPFSFTKTNL
jgi:cytidine deaminase